VFRYIYIYREREKLAAILTFRKYNKNWPTLQQILNLLRSWPNALNTPAENVIVYPLEFIAGNFSNFVVGFIPSFFQKVGIRFIHFILSAYWAHLKSRTRLSASALALVSFWALFAILRKAPMNFVISVCPSVLHMEQLGSRWTDFHESFSKICTENSSFINIWQK
jgi:hypothetical protein